jgi:hypothetical protein
MSKLAQIASSLGLTCLVAVSFAAVCSGAETAPPFLVASTLDGKTVLPHRIVWRGVPPITPWASVPIPHSTRCAKTQICPSWSVAVNLRSPAGDISRSGTSAPAARARS